MGQGYKKASVLTLQAMFRYHSVAERANSFAEAGDSFLPAYRQLKMLMDEGQRIRTRRTPRRDVEYPNSLQVVKERRYAELEEPIAAENNKLAAEREATVEAASVVGLLEECYCCYSTDCLIEDMIQCKSGHRYCKDCVTRGASVAIGDGRTIIGCLPGVSICPRNLICFMIISSCLDINTGNTGKT